jgi:hypothetical protein
VHSYVSLDRTRTVCVYDAPSPEAIRDVGQRNKLPVDSVTEVCVLDPYFYLRAGEPVARSHLRTPWLPFSYLDA